MARGQNEHENNFTQIKFDPSYIALSREVEVNPAQPELKLVRGLARAFIELDSTKYTQLALGNGEDRDSHETDSLKTFMTKTLSERVLLISGKNYSSLSIDTVTTHPKRQFMPSIMGLGAIAFRSTSIHNPLEYLHISTPKNYIRLRLDTDLQQPTAEAANTLLELSHLPRF